MANRTLGNGQGSQRPAGARFRTPASADAQRTSQRATPSPYTRPGTSAGGTRYSSSTNESLYGTGVSHGAVQPAYNRAKPKKSSPIPVIIAVLVVIALVAAIVLFVFPRLFAEPAGGAVEAGQQVTLTVPEGASGDSIASLLSQNHVIDDPSDYYAAVKKLGAETSLKPGDYRFETGQDPIDVVKQLVSGPNIEGAKLTVPEGQTVSQTAELVEKAYGIPAADFIAQAKASAYLADYPFLSEAADDSLEGFLFPKTYSFSAKPTVDQVIRAMLDQYQTDVASALDFEAGRTAIKNRYGVELSNYQVLNLASIVEREGLNAEQRAHVASVFLNRLSGKLTGGVTLLNSDATMMYVTGGAVTADDLKQDSPYNSYKNPGLPPTPICSPSVESIQATLNPTDSNDLYFYITQDREVFSETYDEHRQSWE